MLKITKMDLGDYNLPLDVAPKTVKIYKKGKRKKEKYKMLINNLFTLFITFLTKNQKTTKLTVDKNSYTK